MRASDVRCAGHFQHSAPEANQTLTHPPARVCAWIITISYYASMLADRFRLQRPGLAEKEISYLRELSDLLYWIFGHHRPVGAAECPFSHASADFYAEVFLSALSQRPRQLSHRIQSIERIPVGVQEEERQQSAVLRVERGFGLRNSVIAIALLKHPLPRIEQNTFNISHKKHLRRAPAKIGADTRARV